LKHIILIALRLDAVKPDNARKPEKQRKAQNQSDTHGSDPDAIKTKKEGEEAKQ
jgi:hypothetical protein